MDYYIFGAHSRGYTLFEYLRTLEASDRTIGFLYDNEEANPDYIESLPVYHLRYDQAEDNYGLNKDAHVYIAVRGVFHESVMSRLKSIGFKKFTCVTPDFDIELRNRYVSLSFKRRGLEFIKIYNSEDESASFIPLGKETEITNSSLFIAKAATDKEFKKNVSLKPFEHIIQVGCSLTETKLSEADYYDDTNSSIPHDTISSRNRQFSELTALYWIWKNSSSDIVGLEHWRRRFILPEDWIDRMLNFSIDVILPVPLCVMPSLRANYLARHENSVWNKTVEIINDLYPGEGNAFEKYCSGNSLYSPCNMIIARRQVISDYCEWLFPILLRLNDEIGILEDTYQNRYPGFISERILNYYFDKKRDRIKIAYADKSFLE